MSGQKAINDIQDKGYHLIEGLLTSEDCQSYKRRLRSLYDQFSPKYPMQPENVSQFHGDGKVKMVYNLQNKDYAFFKTISHPQVLPLLKHFLSGGSYNDCEPYCLKLSAGRGLAGAIPAQQLHIDACVPGTHLPLVMQTLWILDDFSGSNGATRIVPKSHKRSSFAENNKKYEDELLVTAPKGSALIYNGSLWHGSSAKSTQDERWIIVNTYCRWFMKPSYDFARCTPQEIFKQLSPDEKELLGLHTTPARDEFTRLSRRSTQAELVDPGYELP